MRKFDDNIRIWDAFAQEIGGEYIPRKYWNSDRTLFNYKNFKIFFDYYTYYSSGKTTLSRTYTRVIIPYKSLDPFNFHIYKDEFILKIAKMFGFQDVKIGKESFDKKFIVKTNNEQKLKNIFCDNNLLEQIENFDKISLLISKDYGIWEEPLPENEYQLSFALEYHVKDLETLHKIKDLAIQFLDRFKDLTTIETSVFERKI